MRSCVRFSFLALLVGVLVAVAAPGAQAAVEVEKFVGVNCTATAEKCGEKVVGADIFGEPIAETVEPSLAESEAQGYRQAAGHVPFGVTDFTLKHTGSLAEANAIPTGIVTHVRVDVAAGLATSPAAVPQCTMSEFGAAEAIPGTGFYAAPKCKEGIGPNGTGPESTVIGRETATVFVEPLAEKGLPPDVTLSGTLYNLVQPEPPAQARASLFGAALKLPIALTKGILEGVFKKSKPEIENAQYYAHTIVEGNVEWGQEAAGTGVGDYHDYFEVKVSPALPVIRSRQEDYGRQATARSSRTPRTAPATTRRSCRSKAWQSVPKQKSKHVWKVAREKQSNGRTRRCSASTNASAFRSCRRSPSPPKPPSRTNRTASRQKSASRAIRRPKSTAPS
jgi:hypothetical protein